MKDKEIEEILEKLKDKDWYEELDLTGTKWIELKQEETNLLLSYIEQLEKENDRLKEVVENLTTMTVNGDTKQIKNTAQYKLEQLQNNRDKAIEYNKNILKENWYGGYEKENAQKNIDILKGDSDV